MNAASVSVAEPTWVSIAFGVLDVSDVETFGSEAELIVMPTLPGVPLVLVGEGASMWRRLADCPIPQSQLNGSEREMVETMEALGIASTCVTHRARIAHISKPWLSSPLHEIVYALVQSIADDNDISAVFIKGPALHRQGLRVREHSGDVDVWVEPHSVTALVARMSEWGWMLQADIWAGASVNHSLTLEPRAGWGAEIDVHRRMPGTGLDDDAAFATIFERSEAIQFAGVPARVPLTPMHAVLASLHETRPEIGRAPDPTSIGRSVAVLQASGGDVVEAAERIDAVIALRAALTTAFPDRRVRYERARAPRDWDWRSQPSRLRAYAVALRGVRPGTRIKVLARLVWPDAASTRESARRAGELSANLFVARLRRLHRGVREAILARRDRQHGG